MQTTNSAPLSTVLGALAKTWVAIVVPIFLCFAAQFPAISKLATPQGHPLGGFLLWGAGAGVLLSLVFCAVVVLPPVLYLRRAHRTAMGAYLWAPIIWTAAICALLGMAAVIAGISADDAGNWAAAFAATWIIGFVIMIVPALMWHLGYWFLAVRTGPDTRAITTFSALFVLWNIICFFLSLLWVGGIGHSG